MANLQTLKGKITSTIYPNGKGAITAADHQALLLDMVDTIDEAIGQSKSDVRADGNYPNMSVGFSANLIGRGESIASEIGFRASGGKSIEDGSARITELQGNAVVWNQLAKPTATETLSGVTFTNNGDGSYTISTGANGATGNAYYFISDSNIYVSNHKVLLLGGISNNIRIAFGGRLGQGDEGSGKIFSESTSISNQVCIMVSSSTIIDTPIKIYPRIHDLTLMFGSGNEPITIDEFYNRMPQGIDIHAYNKGQLIFSNAYGIKSVGDNAWNGEWEMGDVSGSNGVEFDSSAVWRNKGYIRILPNENYYVQSSAKVFLRARFYDADKNFIGIVSANNTDVYTNETFKTAANAHYMRFAPNVSVIAQGSQLCVSLVHSGYKEGKYFPYQENIKTLDYRILDAFPDGMKPWDKVYNKNGKGYIAKGTGVFEDLSQLNWAKNGSSSTGGVYYANYKGTITSDNISTQLVLTTGKYEISNNAYNYGTPTKNAICLAYGALYISDLDINDVDALKASLQGVPLYYELATPTIIEYDEPFNLDYEVWDFGTEEMLADVPSAPIKGMIRYQFNAVDEVRELRQMITALQTAIANL